MVAIEVGAITKTAKVTAVDPAKRMVTLVNPDGITNTYELGKNIRNFDQIKVGDEALYARLQRFFCARFVRRLQLTGIGGIDMFESEFSVCYAIRFFRVDGRLG